MFAFRRVTKSERTTKVFAKAGLDNVTSSMCKHQRRFGLDVQCSALVHNFSNIFSNGHLYQAGQLMNSLPSQILDVSGQAQTTSLQQKSMRLKDPKLIWQVPIYLPYLQPTLNDDIIKDAELKIGHKLPEEYISLLRIQNGGYIRYSLPNTPHEVIAGIGPIFPSITEFGWLDEYEGSLSFELNGLVPFDGDGHWNICFDYRKNKIDPEITYIDTESDYETKIAESFNDYCELLVLKTDGEYVIQSDGSFDDAIKKISASTGIMFEEPDTFAHGYPIYRGKVNDAWIWVSPNKVSKGFVRPDDDRYEELKHWMEKSSLRYPELSENDLLISSSEEIEMKKLLDILANKGVIIIELSRLLDERPNR